jgi:RNA polymerase sigma factor (sigma-70 family)
MGAAASPATGDDHDDRVMARVRDGDLAALGELFERHHGRLYAFCLRSTGSPAAAEDLVQEVFIRLLRYRHGFRPGSRFLGWMYQTARNTCIDHFRERAREAPSTEEVEPTVSERPVALRDLERAETCERVRAALARLPEDRREVLVLSRFQQLKYRQIAEILGCSEGAVKVRVHRAVKQLREIYLEMSEEAAS